MTDTTDKVNDVLIEEVMRADAATVSAHDSMQQVAQVLTENNQHGACVVDEVGHCVGVVTSWDFVRLEQNRESICDSGSMGTVHELIREHSGGPYTLDASDYEDVRRHMTPLVQTINRNATVYQAARAMTENGLHQLIVLDETHRPLGVVTSSDLIDFAIPPVTE